MIESLNVEFELVRPVKHGEWFPVAPLSNVTGEPTINGKLQLQNLRGNLFIGKPVGWGGPLMVFCIDPKPPTPPQPEKEDV